ncbi:MAG: biosynthetic-type acetolactate synthase large subunit [bacterium]
MKTTKKSSSSEKAPAAIKGAQVVIQCLEREGVDLVFAYPGGASIELHQALVQSKKIRTVLPRTEQGGGFMAHGYARSTGKVGVCMATSGPGATNLVTTIADAYMDSVPMVAITGQVSQQFIGKSAFQEIDIFGMTLPIVKHSYLVLQAEELPRIIQEAFHVARSGRPGPVMIDIPKDVQQKKFVPEFPAKLPPMELPKATDEELLRLLELFSKSRKPVIYAGGGIFSGEAHLELRKFAELTGAPVASTLMGLGCLPSDHPLSLKWIGMHGTAAGNWAVHESDLLVALGARFDDRVTGLVSKFAPHATIAHVDIDRSEHQKNKLAHLPIHSDVKFALKRLLELAKKSNFQPPQLNEWLQKIRGWQKSHPFSYKSSPHILPQEAIRALYELTKGDAIVATGVGQHQMWTPQFYEFSKPRQFISSLGLGTMGFGLPAAIGVKMAHPDKQVIDIDGDGSLLMNVQQFATAKIENVAIKVLLINNQRLGMVAQWEDRFYSGIRGHTITCDPKNLGGPENLSAVYPDFVKMAESYGIRARRVSEKKNLRKEIQAMLDADEPYVLEVIVPPTEHVLPFIPPGKSALEIMVE